MSAAWVLDESLVDVAQACLGGRGMALGRSRPHGPLPSVLRWHRVPDTRERFSDLCARLEAVSVRFQSKAGRRQSGTHGPGCPLTTGPCPHILGLSMFVFQDKTKEIQNHTRSETVHIRNWEQQARRVCHFINASFSAARPASSTSVCRSLIAQPGGGLSRGLWGVS